MLKYLTILILLTYSLIAETIDTNKITKIVDGDTIRIVDKNNIESRYRLAGIDTPESMYNAKAKKDIISCNVTKEVMLKLGKGSKEYLMKSIYSKKNITYTIVDKDYRERYVIWIDYVNKELVTKGYATVEDYKNLPKEYILELEELERIAIKKKLGMWKYLTKGCM